MVIQVLIPLVQKPLTPFKSTVFVVHACTCTASDESVPLKSHALLERTGHASKFEDFDRTILPFAFNCEA